MEYIIGKDMKRIFPESVRKEMNNISTDGTLRNLDEDIKNQAEQYFNQ